MYTNLRGQECEKWCRISYDRKDVGIADMLLFSELPEEQVPMPKIRHPWQVWGFYTQEPPFLFARDKNEIDQWKFNWTLTYRHDSDIQMPYGKLETKRHLGKPELTDRELAQVRCGECDTGMV